MESRLQVKTKCNQEVDEVAEPVSPTASYFNSESLSIVTLAVLESAVPIDDSCAMPLLRDLFLPINPRFSSIMVYDQKGIRRWQKVEVNLQDHVNIPSFPEGLPLESYDELFDEYLTKIGVDSLPETRPLWEIYITKYPTSNAAGHLIFKLHQALGDGYSLMGALLSCMERADNPSLPLTFPSIRPSTKAASSRVTNVISSVPRTVSSVCNGMYDFGWTFVKSTWVTDDKTPIRSGNGDTAILPKKISTVSWSLGHVKQIKMKLGVTLNAVLTGIISYGARLYMKEYGTEFCNSRTTATVLFNTRNVQGYKSIQEMLKPDTQLWGNHITLLHVELPELTTCKSSKPLDFVLEAQKNILRMKTSPSVYLTSQMLEIMKKCRGPEAVAQYIESTIRRSSFAISSLIGPVEQMALANHPIKGLYFTALGVPQSLMISVLSYMEALRIGVGVEKGFIDSKKFNSCLENAFQIIYKAATESV